MKVQGVGVALVLDVTHLVGTEDIEAEGSEDGHHGGVFADARGILGEGAVTDAMVAVFDTPVAADNGFIFARGAPGSGHIKRDFRGHFPLPAARTPALTNPGNLYDLRNERQPLRVGCEIAIKHPGGAGFHSSMAGFRSGSECIDGHITCRRDAAIIQQLLLIFFDLHHAVVAAVLDRRKCFFGCAWRRA